MRDFLYSTIIFLMVASVSCGQFIIHPYQFGEVTPPTYLLEETMEAAGTDLTWTTLPAGWDADGVAAPIDGSESMEIGSDAGSGSFIVHDLGAGYTSMYCILKLTITTNSNIGKFLTVTFLDASDVAICSSRLVLNATDQAYRLYLYHSGDATQSADNTFSSTRSDGVLKLEYIAGSGSDGYARSRFTDLADYAANTWAGNEEGKTVTTSTDTASVRKIKIDSNYDPTVWSFDSVRANDTDTVNY